MIMSNKDWKTLAIVASVGGLVVGLHGITSKRWTNAHTLFVLLGAIAAVGLSL